ncbi:hypothetical protein K438DRAFT_1787839 [Mycena galopus ATCC 62051]|nr:hypothetical protein K438DRAFT_1787839 [Mycena galopus ATCC 62051]
MNQWKHTLYPTERLASSLMDLKGASHQPQWYSSTKHTRAWNPTSATEDDADPLAFLFSKESIQLEDETVYVGYGGNGREIHDKVGCSVDREWTDKITRLSSRLNAMCMVAAGNSAFYAPMHEDEIGDMPTPVNAERLTGLHLTDEKADQAIEDAKLGVLDLCGFLAWISSLNTGWRNLLTQGEARYLASLKLELRPKRGAMFKLSTDYHELNLEHWAWYDVPVHYPWTTDESSQGHFVRCSPEYVGEVIEARNRKGGGEVRLEDLSLSNDVLDDLQRFNEWFQDSHSERRGFSPLRPNERANPVEAPRSHGWALTCFAEGEFGGQMDEAELFMERESLVEGSRSQPAHRYILGTKHKPRVDEAWSSGKHRPTLEQRLASPRPGTYGSHYYPTLASGARRRPTSARSASPNRENPRRGRTRSRSPTQRHSSRRPGTERHSGSPSSGADAHETRRLWVTDDDHYVPDRGMSEESPFEGEFNGSRSEGSIYEDAMEKDATDPEEDNLRDDDLSAIQSRKHVTPIRPAIRDLVANIWHVSEPAPTRPGRADAVFNEKWLDKAILRFKDSRSHIRGKIIANCYNDMKKLQDLLNAIWKFGIPFNLYIPETDVGSFTDWTASPWDELAQSSVYELGYSERFMTKVSGSAKTQFGIWVTSTTEVVKCPNGVGFIYEGGIYSELAQALNPTLVERWSRGPSLQVTLFSKGDKFLERDNPEGKTRRFLTTDCISEAEKLILLGYIPGSTTEQDRTLFPSAEILEEGSDHFRGMTGAGALSIIEGLLKKAQNNPKWHTAAQWRNYLRPNNFGERAPTHVPTDEDFDVGAMKLRKAFPVNWQLLPVQDAHTPETHHIRFTINVTVHIEFIEGSSCNKVTINVTVHAEFVEVPQAGIKMYFPAQSCYLLSCMCHGLIKHTSLGFSSS